MDESDDAQDSIRTLKRTTTTAERPVVREIRRYTCIHPFVYGQELPGLLWLLHLLANRQLFPTDTPAFMLLSIEPAAAQTFQRETTLPTHITRKPKTALHWIDDEDIGCHQAGWRSSCCCCCCCCCCWIDLILLVRVQPSPPSAGLPDA